MKGKKCIGYIKRVKDPGFSYVRVESMVICLSCSAWTVEKSGLLV